MLKPLTTLALLLLTGCASITQDRDPGGSIAAMATRIDAQHGAVRPLDGWYMSSGTLWLGYSRACIVQGADVRFLFHAAHGPQATKNPWEGIIIDEPTYHALLVRTPWGRRIYDTIHSRGWLDTPEFHEMTGAEAIALGVPVCNATAR